MKNLLIHLNAPEYEWQSEVEPLLKIQIDNSLRFWSPEDIVLVTNFPYRYNGVEARQSTRVMRAKPTLTKVAVMLELLEEEDEEYWFHDLDAFQLEPLDHVLTTDMALTDYGITTLRPSYNQRWSTGSWFFRPQAKDMLQSIFVRAVKDVINEEAALGRIIKDRPALRRRIEKLNITYNFATRKRDVEKTMEIAQKPIKVLHFHPFDSRPLSNGMTNLELCFPMLAPDLQDIFLTHL